MKKFIPLDVLSLSVSGYFSCLPTHTLTHSTDLSLWLKITEYSKVSLFQKNKLYSFFFFLSFRLFSIQNGSSIITHPVHTIELPCREQPGGGARVLCTPSWARNTHTHTDPSYYFQDLGESCEGRGSKFDDPTIKWARKRKRRKKKKAKYAKSLRASIEITKYIYTWSKRGRRAGLYIYFCVSSKKFCIKKT